MEEQAKEIISTVQDLQAVVKGDKKPTALELLPVVMKAVEAKSAVKAMSSAEKRALALAIIAQLTKMTPADEAMVSALLSVGVGMVNKLFGKKWLKKAA